MHTFHLLPQVFSLFKLQAHIWAQKMGWSAYFASFHSEPMPCKALPFTTTHLFILPIRSSGQTSLWNLWNWAWGLKRCFQLQWARQEKMCPLAISSLQLVNPRQKEKIELVPSSCNNHCYSRDLILSFHFGRDYLLFHHHLVKQIHHLVKKLPKVISPWLV
jgi:hypothetical protein